MKAAQRLLRGPPTSPLAYFCTSSPLHTSSKVSLYSSKADLQAPIPLKSRNLSPRTPQESSCPFNILASKAPTGYTVSIELFASSGLLHFILSTSLQKCTPSKLWAIIDTYLEYIKEALEGVGGLLKRHQVTREL